jgi:coproporphyrinogen III oxidase-like Fe-S oxidoreductase
MDKLPKIIDMVIEAVSAGELDKMLKAALGERRVSALAADGLVQIEEKFIRVTEQGRPFVRMVCAGFDSYYRTGVERSTPAV